MKKHIRKYLCALLATLSAFTFSLTGCGGGKIDPGSSSESVSSGESSSENTGEVTVDNPIRVDPLDLGADFNSDYYPKKENIEQRTGKIDVVIVFEGTKVGWQALADEYMRLHSRAVSVRLDTNYSSGTYSDALKYEITNENRLGYRSGKYRFQPYQSVLRQYVHLRERQKRLCGQQSVE